MLGVAAGRSTGDGWSLVSLYSLFPHLLLFTVTHTNEEVKGLSSHLLLFLSLSAVTSYVYHYSLTLTLSSFNLHLGSLNYL